MGKTAMYEAFDSLGNPTRLAIFKYLKEGDASAGDMAKALNTSMSKLSFHLKNMKESGLLHSRNQGRWRIYSLNMELVDEMSHLLTDI